MDKIKLPPGFIAHTTVTFLAAFHRVPNIAIDLAKRANPASTDDEIGPGVETMRALEAKGLILFAERQATGEPAFFIAAPADFDSLEEHVAAMNMLGYFDTNGDFDARRGEIVSGDGRYVGDLIENGKVLHVKEWFEKSSNELRKLQDEMRCSRKVLEAMLIGLEARGLLSLRDADDGISAHILVKDVELLSPRERELSATIARLFGVESHGRVTVDDLAQRTGPGEHTYMRAIEVQYQAAADMARLFHLAHTRGLKLFEHMPAEGLYAFDMRMLRAAETYCWFDDPTRAAEAASVSLPTSVRATRDLTSGQSGWWYFVNPLDVLTVSLEPHDVARINAQAPMIALLWAWDSRTVTTEFGAEREQYGIAFSCYIQGEYRDGRVGPMPTLKFFWPDGMSLERMLLMTDHEYIEKYEEKKFGEPNKHYYDAGEGMRTSHKETMQGVERVARFFAAGSLWIQQRILSYAKAPTQRHWRKRTERELKPERSITDVQIVQLRRRQVVTSAKSEGDGTPVDWKCRWIVAGHWRNQYYPSKGRHEEKWIDSYPKGPDDKPLKVPAHRVYAVAR